MISIFNAADHYWLCANKDDKVFSSARSGWFLQSDAVYLTWVAEGNIATQFAGLSDGDVAWILWQRGLSPVTVRACGATAFGGELATSDLEGLMFAMGCQIASTENPDLDGVYPLDGVSQQRISAEALYVQTRTLQGSPEFTNGQATKGWPDVNGVLHTFNPTEFVSFALAVARMVDIVVLAARTLPWATPTMSQSIP